MSNLIFNDEVFIPINEAGNYLVDDRAVSRLKQLYIRYQGFADHYSKLDESTSYEAVYVNGMLFYDNQKFDEQFFMDWKCRLHSGTVKANGKNVEIPQGSYFKLEPKSVFVYARQSELDDLSDEYGIPINTTELDDDTPTVEVPTIKHTSELLEIAKRATDALWLNHEPESPPTKAILMSWLESEGIELSANKVNQIDSIIRPNRYKGGKNTKK